MEPPPTSQRDVKDRMGWGSDRAPGALSKWRALRSAGAPAEQGAPVLGGAAPRSSTPVSRNAEHSDTTPASNAEEVRARIGTMPGGDFALRQALAKERRAATVWCLVVTIGSRRPQISIHGSHKLAESARDEALAAADSARRCSGGSPNACQAAAPEDHSPATRSNQPRESAVPPRHNDGGHADLGRNPTSMTTATTRRVGGSSPVRCDRCAGSRAGISDRRLIRCAAVGISPAWTTARCRR